MMDNSAVVLHKGKDKAIKNRHHWIFSGAVKTLPAFENGNILAVRSADGEFLGCAYFNRESSIIGRMISFDDRPPLETLKTNVEQALILRKSFFDDDTNAYRLINGEGDRIPGLIVDRYKDVLVVQVSTLGMEKLKPFLVDLLVQRLSPRSVYEKSNLPSRREEGLPMFEGLLYGEPVRTIEVLENGRRFLIDILESQKTGFYLDQREMRKLVQTLSGGRRVLNAFSYTGSFSVFALASPSFPSYAAATSYFLDFKINVTAFTKSGSSSTIRIFFAISFHLLVCLIHPKAARSCQRSFLYPSIPFPGGSVPPPAVGFRVAPGVLW